MQGVVEAAEPMARPTAAQLIGEARGLVTRLHDDAKQADGAIAHASAVLERTRGMKEFQNDLHDLNDLCHQRPRSGLVHSLRREDRQMRQLKEENRELRTTLEEHQNTIDLVMHRYRQMILRVIKLNKIHEIAEKAHSEEANAQPSVELSRLHEFAGVFDKCLQMGEEASRRDQQENARLRTENETLRRLLRIGAANDADLRAARAAAAAERPSTPPAALDATVLFVPADSSSSSSSPPACRRLPLTSTCSTDSSERTPTSDEAPSPLAAAAAAPKKAGASATVIAVNGNNNPVPAVRRAASLGQAAAAPRQKTAARTAPAKRRSVDSARPPVAAVSKAVVAEVKGRNVLHCRLCTRGFHDDCIEAPPRQLRRRDSPVARWTCLDCQPSKSTLSPTESTSAPPNKAERSPAHKLAARRGSDGKTPTKAATAAAGGPSPRLLGSATPQSVRAERKRVNEMLRSAPCDGAETADLERVTTAADLQLFRKACEAAQWTPSKGRGAADGGTRVAAPWVHMAGCQVRAWYPALYPQPLASLDDLYICEFCLKCLPAATLLRRHAEKCPWRHPPGNEIYRKHQLSFWEVDGRTAKVYCRNLCLLAKMFLDHKTLCFEVEPFLFYVMTVADNSGCHLVGYYSKEKESLMNCNLSCLLTLPHCQRKGYGRLLIDFSYLLSKLEGKLGSPEHPLSDMGLLTYRNYWRSAIADRLLQLEDSDSISIKDLSAHTAIHPNDIVSTMQYTGVIKYWKGRYYVSRNQQLVAEARRRAKAVAEGSEIQLDADCLHWQPASLLRQAAADDDRRSDGAVD